jgi:deazaflavin-dependent oxidoreductase (nitroreductase family)
MIISDDFWRKMKRVQGLHKRLYASGKGWIIGWIILLLEHTGRKSGKRYVTPLQYEKIDNAYYVGAGRGQKCDWFRNIQADPHVHVQVGGESFDGLAEPLNELAQVVAFLECRFERHPFIMGLMMKFHRLPMKLNQAQMENLARQISVVKITPQGHK